MLGKRGQVTIFFILGILLLLLLGSVQMLSLRNQNKVATEVVSQTSSLSNEVGTLLQSCFDEVLQDAVIFTLRQSGQYKTGDADNFPVFYPVIEPKNDEDYELEMRHHPRYRFSKTSIGESIERYTTDKISRCTTKAVFEFPELTFESYEVATVVGDYSVASTITVKGSIEGDDSTYTLAPIMSSVEANMGNIITTVNTIMSASVEQNTIPFDMIINLEPTNQFIFDVDTFESASGVEELVRCSLQFEDYLVYVGAHFDWSVGEHS